MGGVGGGDGGAQGVAGGGGGDALGEVRGWICCGQFAWGGAAAGGGGVGEAVDAVSPVFAFVGVGEGEEFVVAAGGGQGGQGGGVSACAGVPGDWGGGPP